VNQRISWRFGLQVLYDSFSVKVDLKAGVGAFPHLKRMSHLVDFDLLKEEEQYGLPSLMIAACGLADPGRAPQNVRYDREEDVVVYFRICALDDPRNAPSSEVICSYFRYDLEIQKGSAKERRKVVQLMITIENPSQDIQEKFTAQKVEADQE
jgi:hypothetical protein